MSDNNEARKAAFQSYEEALEWITGRAPVLGIRPGLGRIEWLMERLEHPERRLKFIHVAGTNGKGSTCAFLNEALLRGGYDVGMFTSPYIERFTDRIRYNGNDIEEEHVLAIANRLKPLAEELEQLELGHPTMFELCTALAILYFATVVYPDYVVWETGLGGRLDVTNIVTPVVSVITNIGHDHMDLLGDSLEGIAREKAGIIKAGVPVVSAVEQPECVEVIRHAAASKKSSLYLLDSEFRYEPGDIRLNEQSFRFESPFRRLDDVTLSLNGPHQMKNASVALMTLEVLRQYYALVLDDEDLYAAFKQTRWAGRLEMLSEQPRLVVDGAHNPEGLGTLVTALQSTYSYRKLHLMMGMVANKNHRDSLRHILPLADTITITEPAWRKKYEADQLAELAREVAAELKLDTRIHVEKEWKVALDRLLSLTGPDDLAVVTGTLYLISDVRSWVLHRAESEKGW
jgi:dihydrofolate synthase / folylpolyglutamate synthase